MNTIHPNSVEAFKYRWWKTYFVIRTEDEDWPYKFCWRYIWWPFKFETTYRYKTFEYARADAIRHSHKNEVVETLP